MAGDISTPQISTHSVLSASDHAHGSGCQHKLIARDSGSHGFRSESMRRVCVKSRISSGDGDHRPSLCHMMQLLPDSPHPSTASAGLVPPWPSAGGYTDNMGTNHRLRSGSQREKDRDCS